MWRCAQKTQEVWCFLDLRPRMFCWRYTATSRLRSCCLWRAATCVAVAHSTSIRSGHRSHRTTTTTTTTTTSTGPGGCTMGWLFTNGVGLALLACTRRAGNNAPGYHSVHSPVLRKGHLDDGILNDGAP